MPQDDRLTRFLSALTGAGARRLWEANTEHRPQSQRIIAYSGPEGIILLHDMGEHGFDVYTQERETNINASLEFALEWMGLADGGIDPMSPVAEPE